ncbi:MAG: cytidylate kinase-like family protein [Bacteroidetes bacterium]|nr:cytidylate kinase-like family protein [Bacteroidota bacterium]
MDNFLHQYLAISLDEESDYKQVIGPVITLSRECGCGAKIVASALCERLNQAPDNRKQDHFWKIQSKEILQSAASKLGIEYARVRQVISVADRNIVDEIISSLSEKYHHSDAIIKNEVGKVITFLGSSGYNIIIGRAGSVILKDHPQALHLRLHAPMEWRIQQVMQRYNLSKQDAIRHIQDNDKLRSQVRTYFSKGKGDDACFDISLNAMTIPVPKMVEIVIRSMEIRGIR